MITPEPPAGSEHYREGWRHGYEQAAIDRERSADAVTAEARVLVARCDNYREDVDAPCTGEIRFRWGMSQSDPCDVCGSRCGVAVAAWERVESADPPPASPGTLAIVRDLVTTLDEFVEEHSDPGTRALGVLSEARRFISTGGTGHVEDSPEVDAIAETINAVVGMSVPFPKLMAAARGVEKLIAARRAGAVPDTGQAREPAAHPVGGFTHDPGLVALVAGQIAETYSDDEYQIRPDPGDVIAAVMETVRADIRDRAEDQARCGKIDECAAKALVLTRLADWLEGWPSRDTVQAPDVAAVALRDAARLLDMVADARDVYLEGMEEDSESAVAIETFGSGIRSAARILRAEPHTVELLVPTWRYLGELAELDAQVRALLGTDTTPDRLAWISKAGETAAAERQARYQETACARRPAEERPDA